MLYIVGPWPLDGCGVLLTLEGVGWGMYWRSCELADEPHATLWLTAGACIHGWGGVGHVLTFMWTFRWRTCYAVAAGRCMYSWVGWGGACINVHANLQMKDMLRCACIHGWGGVGEVGHVLTFMWTCILLRRYCKFSWTLHSYVRHATLL